MPCKCWEWFLSNMSILHRYHKICVTFKKNLITFVITCQSYKICVILMKMCVFSFILVTITKSCWEFFSSNMSILQFNITKFVSFRWKVCFSIHFSNFDKKNSITFVITCQSVKICVILMKKCVSKFILVISTKTIR